MTKIPTKVIELAQQGGWKKQYDFIGVDSVFVRMRYISKDVPNQPLVSWMWERVALDREFWIALGNTLHWHVDYSTDYWMGQAQNFYQCILSGQDPTEWWAQLTANK